VVISSIYWTLMTLFPTLILPPNPEFTEPTASSEVPAVMRLPLSHDLSLHAAPGIAMVADFLLFEIPYSKKSVSYRAPLAAFAFCLWYGSWVEYCATYNGSCNFCSPFLFLALLTMLFQSHTHSSRRTLCVRIYPSYPCCRL
jgi:hypothetical protein